MTAPCVHRWRCETPDGPLAREECRLCGEVRFSHNVYLPDRSVQAGKNWAELAQSEPRRTDAEVREKRRVRPGGMKDFPLQDVTRGMA